MFLALTIIASFVALYFVGYRFAQVELDAKRAELVARGIPVDYLSLVTFHESLTDTDLSEKWTMLLDRFYLELLSASE